MSGHDPAEQWALVPRGARRQGIVRRYLLNPLEAVAALSVYTLFRALPMPAASALGGWLGRMLGPLLPLTGTARRNIARAMPDLDEAAVRKILCGMWDNLGRNLGEFPHLDGINVFEHPNIEVIGAEYVDALRDDDRPGIFFSAHLGNWELLSYAASQRGLPVHRFYRAANNPLVERLYRRGRRNIAGDLMPKGAEGSKRALAYLRRKEHLGLLMDQKMNDGIAVPFFGRDAMTAPALAQFALRFECPVVPARVIRLGGARFRIEIEPPCLAESTGDRHADIFRFMTQVNARIEAWIREHPEQWLWVHRRWPKTDE